MKFARMSSFGLPLLAITGLWLSSNSAAVAQNLFYSDSFNFAGTWSSYNTLADAQSHILPVGGGSWVSQPITIYVDGSIPNNIFATAFYALPPSAPFMAVYDPTSSTLADTSVFFTQSDLSVSVTQQGATATGSSRFDPTGLLSPALSGGDWFSFAFNAKASGIVFPDLNGSPPYNSFSNPSGVSGAFSGVFHRTGGDGLFFAVDLTAAFGGARVLGQPINSADAFISSTIPEPTAICAAGVVLAMAAGASLRRAKGTLSSGRKT